MQVPFNFQTRCVYMHVYVHSHYTAAVISLANILYVLTINIMKSLKSFQEKTGNEGWKMFDPPLLLIHVFG